MALKVNMAVLNHICIGGTERRIYNLIKYSKDKWVVCWTNEVLGKSEELGFRSLKNVVDLCFMEDVAQLARVIRKYLPKILFFYANMVPIEAWSLLEPGERPRYVYTAGTNSEITYKPWQRGREVIDVVICVSRQIMQQINSVKAVYIPTGVDTELFQYKKHPRNGLVFGYFGRIAQKKRIDEIPVALKGYTDRFVVYGSQTDDLLDKIKESCDKNGILFDYRGISVKPEKDLHDIDVLMLFSRREGMPNSVLEAAACGVPTISTRVGDLMNTFIDDEDILFADTMKELRQKVAQLYEKPSEVERLGFNARKTVEKQHSLQNMVKQYEFVFESLLG